MTPRARAPLHRARPPWISGLGAAFVAVAAFLPAAPVHALWNDALTLSAAETATRDDNVFRISKDVDPATAIGSSSKGDTYHTTSLGISFDVPASRQRFRGGYVWNDSRYDRFTDLDFIGHEGRAVWLWQLGNDASGQLGYSETSALASFTNIQSRSPDPLKVQRSFFDSAFRVTPRWLLQAGASRLEQTNGDPVRRINDIEVVGANVAIAYVTPAGFSVGPSFRAEDGRFPNKQFIGGRSVDNAYRQYGAGVAADWTVTGVSRVNARLERVRRSYVDVPERDFDGTTARAEYDWKPTGKLSLAGSVRRDISPYESTTTSFILERGVTLVPTLSVTEKVELSGRFDYGVREYLGDPGFVLSTGLPSRTDRVSLAGMTVSYRPGRAVTLQLGAQRERRTSNIEFADYTDNIAFANLRIAF